MAQHKIFDAWYTNKYLLATLGFLAIIFFFDKNDIFTQWDRSNKRSELQKSKKYYEELISAEKKELYLLQNDPATVEKYARELYLMKKEGEVIFLEPNYTVDK